jgi:hypothetical protein
MTQAKRTLFVQTPQGAVACTVVRVQRTAHPDVYALVLEGEPWIADGSYACVMHKGELRTPGTVQIVPYEVDDSMGGVVVSFVQMRGLFRPDRP